MHDDGGAVPDPAQVRHASVADRKDVAVLGAGLDLQRDRVALERRHLHGRAERSLRDVHAQLVEQVVLITLEHLVRGDAALSIGVQTQGLRDDSQ